MISPELKDLPPPQLIIFDCDGTICDTEIVWAETMADVFSRFGPPLSVEDAQHRYEARPINKVIEHYRTMPGVDLPENIFDLLCRRMDEGVAARGAGCCVPGALECVLACAKTYKVAVATNGEVSLTRNKLTAIGLLQAMPDIEFFTKDVVQNAKPAPDLFLYVAHKFDVAPKDTWVLEDSVTGVAAGVAAGMTTIGFTGCAHDKNKTAQALRDAGAVYVFDDYKDFPLAV